ncbi:IS3 family transposase [Sporomusa sphaeroides DSM 2875]|uniref:IS3 family transposase n=1 Tax=Sporomusa sphaeroides TaxID=47679 RepID=UPI0020309FD3|nr:IS3 family transposase [Sporomusa sphaeroides]MCM0761405.1 IS3 family transposase [Sporomusa sphaeroides DSM 2875]
MCRILKVSRAGYYKYLNTEKSKRDLENEALTKIISEIYQQYKKRYGYRRITAELRSRGIKVNHKRISRIMRKLGYSGDYPRKKHGNYRKVAETLISENILEQKFIAEGKNKIWVGDITYIKTREGFLYLMVYLDIYTRKVVGWSMDKTMSEQIAIDALQAAVWSEKPPRGLIIHTDRGSQFIGKQYKDMLLRHGFKASMSRPGNPYDNAVAESFHKTLKTELVRNSGIFTSREIAKKSVFEYIEIFYNRQRKHSALGYLSPRQFEQQF